VKTFRILTFCLLQLEDEIADLKAQKDTEVSARDTKLARLKMQMADSLTDNSRYAL